MKPATITIGRYEVNLGDDMGQKKGYLDAHYFEFYDQIISAYVRPGDTVLDIGAHVGVTATMLSQAVGDDGSEVGSLAPRCVRVLVFMQPTCWAGA